MGKRLDAWSFVSFSHLQKGPRSYLVSQNAGQNCIGIERLIVHSEQYDELYEILTERAKKLRLGSVLAPSREGYINTVDLGCMITNDRFDLLEQLIFEAHEAGAQMDVGGKQYRHPSSPGNAYFSCTVLGDVSPRSRIAQTECELCTCSICLLIPNGAVVFAPVALLIRYDDIEEAIKIANGTRYGLGASVFGPHQDLCLEVARELECGMVSINDFGVYYVSVHWHFINPLLTFH